MDEERRRQREKLVDEIGVAVDPDHPMTDDEKQAILRLLESCDANPMPPELARRLWRVWSGGSEG